MERAGGRAFEVILVVQGSFGGFHQEVKSACFRRTLLLVAGVGLSRGMRVRLVSELHYTLEAKISKESGRGGPARQRQNLSVGVCV